MLLLLAAAYVMASSILLSAGDAAEGSDLPALVVIPLITIAFLEPQAAAMGRRVGHNAPALLVAA